MILCKRPHFHIRDGAVYFLNSNRPLPALSQSALDLLAAVDVAGELNDPAPTRAVQELTARGLCDLITPINHSDRRPVLVLEPHCDDAALSIGGLMWQRRTENHFTLVTLASHSNYTSSFHTGRDFFNRKTVSDLRASEGRIFMAHLGGDYRMIGLPEATMRYADNDWTVDFFRAHRASVAINNNRQAPANVLAQWIKALTPLMIDPTYKDIWIPLGAGSHSDHDLARNAALSILMAHPQIMQRARIYLYKDVPYGVDFPNHTNHILSSLNTTGAQLEGCTADITDAFDKKLDLLGIFASQFKVHHIQSGVERSAKMNAPEGRLHEHLWQLKTAPKTLDTFALFCEAPGAMALQNNLRRWVRAGVEVRHLRVLALDASGRWKDDEQMFKNVFPNAHITVYASSASYAEIALHKNTDICLHNVGQGPRAWAQLALKLALVTPSHILFVAGDRFKTARKLAALWPLHDACVVERMDHVALAINQSSECLSY